MKKEFLQGFEKRAATMTGVNNLMTKGQRMFRSGNRPASLVADIKTVSPMHGHSNMPVAQMPGIPNISQRSSRTVI